MSRVILCTGEYAKTPYYFENLGIRVFSAEELCYVLKENAFLLDREILDKKLVRFIDESLGLSELAAQLYPMPHRKVSVSAFVGVILEYVGFYDGDTVKKTEEIYRAGANLNVYEKLKSRVDHMVESGRYANALAEYDALLMQLPEGEKELSSAILHNMGVAFCGLFAFESAEKRFRAAYDLIPRQDELVCALAAKRMSMEEDDYIAYAAGFPEYYEETLEVEKKVEVLRRQFEESEQEAELAECLSHKEDGSVALYYEEMDRIAQRLKEEYRTSVTG